MAPVFWQGFLGHGVVGAVERVKCVPGAEGTSQALAQGSSGK